MKKTLPTEETVARNIAYWGAYLRQPGVSRFVDHVVIEDALYGLGASLSDEYQNADGYRKLKADLLRFLSKRQETSEREEKYRIALENIKAHQEIAGGSIAQHTAVWNIANNVLQGGE